MPADLLEYWKAYAGIRPFGHENRLLAHLCALTYNIHRGDNPALDPDVFLPVRHSKEEIREAEMERGLLQAMKRNRERKP